MAGANVLPSGLPVVGEDEQEHVGLVGNTITQ
jgi:hypothetical protein